MSDINEAEEKAIKVVKDLLGWRRYNNTILHDVFEKLFYDSDIDDILEYFIINKNLCVNIETPEGERLYQAADVHSEDGQHILSLNYYSELEADRFMFKPLTREEVRKIAKEREAKRFSSIVYYFYDMYTKNPHYFDSIIGEAAVAKLDNDLPQTRADWDTLSNRDKFSAKLWYYLTYLQKHHGETLEKMRADRVAEILNGS
jgi:hypothetical protein